MLFHTISSAAVWLLFSLALIIAPLSARALVVEDLYVAEVLVTDESSTQLRTGARAGLLQVLVRVSGAPDVEASSLIRASLRNPTAYYYQYSYEASDQMLLRRATMSSSGG